ncbi:MAG: PadR family transcriptional regulator [Candidatus Omnitrophica bacterium]|nr:PadR family transcriptional regulator [Candidatus Omnitrophota bacterium]MDD5351693.1 PadR family transcriptional regulator [Candidatus Omnitrophota bacterium]MDD5550903.1 PadR family transcriptional regulator [Candidatus Omnitrophota bacterium]
MKLEQELVILGLLKDKPRHGYEIRKQINDFLTYFTGLGYESIYYSLTALEKKGIVKRIVTASKNRPDKYVYSLTEKGKERFSALLDKSFLHIQRPYFGIDISLFFLPYLDSDNVRIKLKARLRILKKIELNLLKFYSEIRSQKPPHLLAILEHNLELIKTEINFVSNLISRLNKI